MEIKHIVKEMLAAGMPESEILSNLTDLGVPDAPKVLAEAKAASAPKASAKPAAVEEEPRTKPSLFTEEAPAPAYPSSKPSLFDERPEPGDARACGIYGNGNGIWDCQVRILHDAGKHSSHEDKNDSADDERTKNAYRHVALRVARFLRRGGNNVKTDVGKKYYTRAAHHAAPAE